MPAALQSLVFEFFLVFCRIGGCLMLAPGFGSPRIPMQVRLFIALAVSLAIAPLLVNGAEDGDAVAVAPKRLLEIPGELAIGLAIGFMARCFILAAQFAATVMANSMGLAGIPGVAVDDVEAMPSLASLMSMAATMVLLTLNLHLELIDALVGTYAVFPIGAGTDFGRLGGLASEAIADTTLLAVQLSGPILVYSIVVNLAIGLAGKFTPQIQVYFMATGAMILGGFLLTMLVAREWLLVFAGQFQAWLTGLTG